MLERTVASLKQKVEEHRSKNSDDDSIFDKDDVHVSGDQNKKKKSSSDRDNPNL